MKHGFKFCVAALSALCALVLAACATGYRTESRGQENVVYLQIAGTAGNYTNALGSAQAVRVVLDGDEATTFDAFVNDAATRATQYEHTYKIAPGAHDIAVYYKDGLILQKKIFASAGEVKIVGVP